MLNISHTTYIMFHTTYETCIMLYMKHISYFAYYKYGVENIV